MNSLVCSCGHVQSMHKKELKRNDGMCLVPFCVCSYFCSTKTQPEHITQHNTTPKETQVNQLAKQAIRAYPFRLSKQPLGWVRDDKGNRVPQW